MSLVTSRPGEWPGCDFTPLPDGRYRLTVREDLASIRVNDAAITAKGTQPEKSLSGKYTAAVDLRLIDIAFPSQGGIHYRVRIYETLHPTAETAAGAPTVTRTEDGRTEITQDWLQFSSAPATRQKVGTNVCTVWPVALSGITGTAATDVLTRTGHGLLTGDRIQFSALTGGAGLATATNYYVIASGLTADAFKLSATSGGSAVNFTTDITAATLALQATAILAEEQAPDTGTLRTIRRRYVTSGLIATRAVNVGGGRREVTYTSVATREDPAGIVLDVDTQRPGGVPVYTVRATQSVTGGDITSGVAFTVGLETPFEYPGRCKFATRTETVGVVDFNFTDLYLSPPISVPVDATVEMRYAARATLAAFTVTGTASSDLIAATGHQLPNGWPVHFSEINGGAGLTRYTTYYVVNAAADTLQLSATVGGSVVNFTTNITASTLVPVAYPHWRPSSWAVLDAFYMLYNDIGGARSKVEGLRGYRIEQSESYTSGAPPVTIYPIVDYQPPSPTSTDPNLLTTFASSVGNAAIAFGSLILTDFSGTANLRGGPAKPGGLYWTLSAKPEEAFTDNAGVTYYRHTIITAYIPEQEELPTWP